MCFVARRKGDARGINGAPDAQVEGLHGLARDTGAKLWREAATAVVNETRCNWFRGQPLSHRAGCTAISGDCHDLGQASAPRSWGADGRSDAAFFHLGRDMCGLTDRKGNDGQRWVFGSTTCELRAV